jgi:hypothetical protein
MATLKSLTAVDQEGRSKGKENSAGSISPRCGTPGEFDFVAALKGVLRIVVTGMARHYSADGALPRSHNTPVCAILWPNPWLIIW